MKQNERDLKFTDWQLVSEQHRMKPHAAKMRFLRIRKQLEDDEPELLAQTSNTSEKSNKSEKHRKSKKNKRKMFDDCTDDEEVLPSTYKCRKLSTEECSLSNSSKVSAATDVSAPHAYTPFVQPYPSVKHLMDRILLLEERLLGAWSGTKTIVKEEHSEASAQEKSNSKWLKTINSKKDSDDGLSSLPRVDVKHGLANENEVIDDGFGGPQLWYHGLCDDM